MKKTEDNRSAEKEMSMNQKQKLGYTLLGAGIMALGIVIGQVVTPNIEARSNGVFDEIQCTKLTVVDKAGKDAIVLKPHPLSFGNEILIFAADGKEAIRLSAGGLFNSIGINNQAGKRQIGLSALMDENLMFIHDPVSGYAFAFRALPQKNVLVVYDKSSERGIGFSGDSNEAKMTKWRE